ncbi:MAG: hypothetical protein AAB354_07830, partial [candidate division KSB1 bacterium]
MPSLKLTSLAFAILIPAHSFAQTPSTARAQFHASKAWSAAPAPRAHVIVLHGLNETFAQRCQTWQQAGYAVHGNVPLAWGNFMDYLTGTWNGTSHFDEIQLRADDTEFDRKGGGYYFVPSASYREYLKKKIELAIDSGAEAIRLEQPFLWSAAGYSDGFKREWENYYQTPWEAPDQSVTAQFQAEQLKFELELRAVSELLAHAKSYGRTIKGYVATLSSLQYAQSGKVGPQAELLYVPECDGVIGQIEAEVHATQYAGVSQARPFESAWFDLGLFAQAARGHEKELVFSFEGGSAASWAERKKTLQAQVVAALFYPECSRYEFQTPVEQLFRGATRSLALASANDGGTLAAESVAAPANEAALQVLVLQHVLEHLPQGAANLEAGERGIGILMSDAITLQRAKPEAQENELASFYGLALPLLKHGMPVQPLPLENLSRPGYLTGYKILLLSYRAFKPQQDKWHERLATWVKTGGALIFVDDEQDAFNRAPGWWREPAHNFARPSEHLFQALGLNNGANPGRNKAGMGVLFYITENPAHYALNAAGPDSILALIEAAMPHGRSAKRQNYFKLQRGPYVAAIAFAETATSATLHLPGDWIDLFDPTLPRLAQKNIPPGETALLFDLSKRDSTRAQVLAASAHIANEQHEPAQYSFTVHGPAHLLTRMVISAPRNEATITAICGGN